jgi:NAD(P)-dependent dehydrogenase (short-subunit alcohol dehydrogenase family)
MPTTGNGGLQGTAGGLRDRVAIVTGAGDGIGLGIARRFAREGATVVIAELDETTGAAAAAGIESQLGGRSLFVPTDVTDRAAVEAVVDRTIEEFGAVDVLVNNAWGGGSMVRLEHSTDEQMEHGLRMAFWAAYWSMLRCFPHMRDAGGGSIINICSLNGVNAHPFTPEYNVGKEALRTLTRTAAREWARHGIRANAICPGAATATYRAVEQAMPDMIAEILSQVPMGYMGDPERDIGGVAYFLASDDSRYLTGNTLFADGGGHINGVPWAPDLPD